MMNDRRSLVVAVCCPAAVVAGTLALWLAAAAPTALERSSANAAAELPAPSPAAKVELADVPRAATTDTPVVVTEDVAMATPTGTSTATDATTTAAAPEPAVKLASADSSQVLPADAPPQPAANADQPPANTDQRAANTETPEPISPAAAEPHEPAMKLASADPTEMLPADTPPLAGASANTEPAADDAKATTPSTDPLETADECLVADVCIDHYLWELYQRTPKEDSIKVQDRHAVTIKRRGKTVTVMRSFTKLVDEDFAWKDPKAADKAGITLMDYVIGGMERGFKLKLFHALHAAQAAGLEPGITSAFRDDYRQAIASGLKAASDRSYHGGSFRGGYGHGLAADVVSVKGETRAQRWTSTEVLWKWIDANGRALGIGRPYLDRDPPHVGPIDGQEYVSRRGDGSAKQAAADVKPHKRQAGRKLAARSEARRAAKVTAVREVRAPAKQPQAGRSARVRAG